MASYSSSTESTESGSTRPGPRPVGRTRPVPAAVGPCRLRRCAVPPYMLEELRRAGLTPAAAEDVRGPDLGHVLALDAQVRAARHRRTRPQRPLATPSGTLHRTISDARNTEELPGVPVRTEGQPPVEDTTVNEAYDGIGSVHAFLEQVYRQSSLDGAGLGLLATVHFGHRYDNAFWDGTQMVFGDGDGVIFTGFTPSLSVIGHELGHGLMQYSTDLDYEGQSGALNESFSDVLGALVEQFAQGQTAQEASWLIGAEVFGPDVQARALRSMAAPGTAYDDPRLGRDPQPAHMDDFVVTAADYGGVHVNSGIPNKAFHLAALALGGHAWERAGQVWFDVVTGEDIPQDVDFAGFAEATAAAARSRFGDEVAEAVRDAWEQVGVLAGAARAPQRPGAERVEPPGAFTVVVERSGGLAGMVRQWMAEIPDDGRAAARAARRITGITSEDQPPGNWRSKVAQNVSDSAEERATSDRQMQNGAARDGFQWSVRCGEGTLQCDEAGRRQDPEVDALIRTVTNAADSAPGGVPGGSPSGP